MSDPSSRIALISTLPKSGTWFAHSFFWCYEQMLRNPADYLSGDNAPDLKEALTKSGAKNDQSKAAISHLSHHSDTLGIDTLQVMHTICPGYEDVEDPLKPAWERLQFCLPYNWGEGTLRQVGHWDQLNPLKNPESRVVYLCRNPLDHFVSYYYHALKHVDDFHRFRTDPHTCERKPIESLHEFVFDFSVLDSFIKHYHTFQHMRNLYPANILIMPYEEWTGNPHGALKKILTFLGAPVDNEEKNTLFAKSLQLCSKDSLATIEQSLGRSLAGDVTDNKHIRSGKTGEWMDKFTFAELMRIEERLAGFGYSLRDFPITANGENPFVYFVNRFSGQHAHDLKLLQDSLIEVQSKLNNIERAVSVKERCKTLLNRVGLRKYAA